MDGQNGRLRAVTLSALGYDFEPAMAFW